MLHLSWYEQLENGAANIKLIVGKWSHLNISEAEYLAVQNGAEEVGLVDLLTGGQNHVHLVVAQGAGVVQVYSTQVLHTTERIREIKGEIKNMITGVVPSSQSLA